MCKNFAYENKVFNKYLTSISVWLKSTNRYGTTFIIKMQHTKIKWIKFNLIQMHKQ